MNSCSEHAHVATGKMSISEVYCKLGHISHTAIKHAISTGQITEIKLDIDHGSGQAKPKPVPMAWPEDPGSQSHPKPSQNITTN
jgi:hypothetical protein